MKLKSFIENRWLLLAALGLVSGCGGGGGGGSANPNNVPVAEPPAPPVVVDACAIEGQKEFALDVADDWYLWYNEMASVNPDDYDSVNEMLDALTAPLAADGRDPGFSYMTTITEDEASFTSGAYVGFGFRWDSRGGNDFYIADALEGGPASDAGFIRGVEVLAIDTGNGFETIDQLAARGATNSELFGPNEAGVERGFRLRDEDQIFEVSIVKRELSTPPLAGGARLIERTGTSPVGYFHMRGFTTSANAPLAEAVSGFAEAGVTDLVIDLRYNGGGLLSVAQNLLDLLGGEIADGEKSFIIGHNEKRVAENSEAFFAARDDGMVPLRIAFITTRSTASASELLINSLSPHVEVVLVGEDTLGKAVGQYAFDQPDCDNRLRLVTFEILNGEALGGYYTGLVDSGRFTLCPAEDDITRRFGDPAEDSLGIALGWLNEGVCGASSANADNAKSQSLAADSTTLPWYPVQPALPDRRSPLWQ
ncbi:MAG: S41 family peptidase [Halieaceae bacterium]|jgi:C-terminal processing protease CtpA/Prc|nr:S41 family peptidase [Halieaceae bacterium]